MSTVIVCDVCGEPIDSNGVRWGDGDYHDTPECIGVMQAAVAKVRRPYSGTVARSSSTASSPTAETPAAGRADAHS